MNKTLLLIEAVNVSAWNRQLSKEKLDKIEFKIRWALKKAIAKITPDVAEFEKMRDEEVKKLQDKWFSSDDTSEEFTAPVLDDDGNEEKDEEGNVKTQEMRRVKDKYLNEYQKDVDELQNKINEILFTEKNTYEFSPADIDAWVESMDDPDPLEFTDLEMLDALLSDNGEA